MKDRVHREFADGDIEKIADAYHCWRGQKGAGRYGDIAGFCKTATSAEIAAHQFALTSGRYVGVAHVEEDAESAEKPISLAPLLRLRLNSETSRREAMTPRTELYQLLGDQTEKVVVP